MKGSKKLTIHELEKIIAQEKKRQYFLSQREREKLWKFIYGKKK